MAYSDFTFAKLKKKYGIGITNVNLFSNKDIPFVEPSKRLIEDIDEAVTMPTLSEKAKSEILIFPVIRELKRNNKNISIFSGYNFNIEGEKDLTGTPDFMISANEQIVELLSPIFCLVESKNRLPDEGFAQCAAEMYAARLFNQQTNEPYEIIYGAVTNAYEWVFLKLEGDTVYIDTKRYYLDNLTKLLGILQFVVNQIK